MDLHVRRWEKLDSTDHCGNPGGVSPEASALRSP
jgi:hypothetical protein